MTESHPGGVSNGTPHASLRSDLAEWSAFFVRHTQHLEQCHNVLFGLCRLEGPPSILRRCEERLASVDRRFSWIRATPQWVPSEDVETSEQIEVLASLTFPMATSCALAPGVGVGFVFTGLGRIGRVDLRRGRRLEPDLTVRRDRPLHLACSQDGRYLAAAFETGIVDVLELDPVSEAAPGERLLWSTRCRVPSYEPPTLQFLDCDVWLQTEDGDAQSFNSATGAGERRIAPPDDLNASELAAVTIVRGELILAWNGETGSRLVCVPDSGRGPQTVSDASEILAVNRWGRDSVAVSLSDRRLCIYDVRPSFKPRRELNLEASASRLAEWGARLWWVSSDGRMFTLASTSETPERLLTGGLALAGVCGLAIAPNGDGLVLTLNSASAFRFGGRATRGVVFQAAFPKSSGYLALGVRRGSYVFVDGVERDTLPVAPDLPHTAGARADGREVGFLFAMDGQGRILVSHGGGAELRDPPTEECEPCNLPDGTISAAGRLTGGFWIADETGYIYSLSAQGVYREAAQASREILGPPRLAAWGSLVVWTGTRVATHATLGRDGIYVQVFFRAVQDRLERIGEREYTAADGLLRTVCWDEARGELISIWQGRDKGSATAKIGKPEALIDGSENKRLLRGLYWNCQEAAVIQDARQLFVLSADGAIRCFDLDTFEPVASLACSEQFTSLSEGVNTRDELVVIAGRQRVLRLHCEGGGSEWTSIS